MPVMSESTPMTSNGSAKPSRPFVSDVTAMTSQMAMIRQARAGSSSLMALDADLI